MSRKKLILLSVFTIGIKLLISSLITRLVIKNWWNHIKRLTGKDIKRQSP